MEYVQYGNSGLQVSKLCWGAMNFYQRVDEDTAIQSVHTALDQGINFFDTADAYGRGEGEKMLGKALKGRRDGVVLATKFWVPMYDWPAGGGCSRFHIMRAVEDSLKRLDTDYIDLYQLHHPDPETPVEETLGALDTLIQQGKVRYIGVANHYAWQVAHYLGVEALHDWEPMISMQVRYNLLDRVIENETVHFAKRFNIALMTYGPLCGGILTGKYERDEEPPEGSRVAKMSKMQEFLTDEVFDILEEIQAMADKYDIGMNQLAVKWVLSKDYITTPIIGGSRPEHFTPMYELFDIEIDEADYERLDELTEQFRFQEFGNQAKVEGGDIALNRW
ncbi:MAG: aldo/keto reductase [Armatimonadota bacterium]